MDWCPLQWRNHLCPMQLHGGNRRACSHITALLTKGKVAKWSGLYLCYMQMGDLVIFNTQYPHLGASPDGVTMCECCDKGVVELKCPYSAIDFTPRNLHWSLKKGTLILLSSANPNLFVSSTICTLWSMDTPHWTYRTMCWIFSWCNGESTTILPQSYSSRAYRKVVLKAKIYIMYQQNNHLQQRRNK